MRKHSRCHLLRNKDEGGSLFSLAFSVEVFFRGRGKGTSKKAERGFSQKFHAAKAIVELRNRRRAARSKNK